MKRILVGLVLATVISSAQAKDITLILNDEEQRVLLQILDMATKANGLSVSQATMHFAKRIEDAAKAPEPEKK